MIDEEVEIIKDEEKDKLEGEKDVERNEITEFDPLVEELLAKLKISKKKKKPKNTDVSGENFLTNPESEEPHSSYTYEYQELLGRIYSKLNDEKPTLIAKKKEVIRPPIGLRLSGKRYIWYNFGSTCDKMNRDRDHVAKFFLCELATTGFIENDSLIIKGSYILPVIRRLLKKYIREYVACKMCNGTKTFLIKDKSSRMMFINCETCGAMKSVSSIEIGYRATGKRKAERPQEREQ